MRDSGQQWCHNWINQVIGHHGAHGKQYQPGSKLTVSGSMRHDALRQEG